MTARQPGDGPLTDESEDTDEPWVSVRPDMGPVKGPLIAGLPLLAIGALRMGLMMAQGRGASGGSGTRGLVIGVLAVVLPFVWAVLLCALRWANAGILLDDGVLTVRNRWHREVLRVPVSSLTGLHQVVLPIAGPHGTRIVVTARDGRRLLIDPRAWNAQELGELWQRLPPSLQNGGSPQWPALKKRFPGVRWPWRHRHSGLFVALVTVGCIAYVALVVNLPFLL